MIKKLVITVALNAIISIVLGQGVYIPISKDVRYIDNKAYFIHQVEKGQTMYSIGKTYQVEMSTIIRGINKPDIQIGEILHIPVNPALNRQLEQSGGYVATPSNPEPKPETDIQTQPMQPYGIPERMLVGSDTLPNAIDDTIIPINSPKRHFQIALLVPLYLDEMKSTSKTPLSFLFVRFYEAAMMALQEVSATSDIKFTVSVFDVTDENSANKLIRSRQLDNMDVLIGPFFIKTFNLMSDYAQEKQIVIINPLSDKDGIVLDNPYVIKLLPSEIAQTNRFLDYILARHVGHRIIVFSDKNKDEEQKLSNLVRARLQPFSYYFDTIMYFNTATATITALHHVLSAKKNNTLLYLSSSEPLIVKILSQTSKLENKTTLFSLKNFDIFEYTEMRYLNDLNLHYATWYYIDHHDEEILNFERRFYQRYKSIPDNYAFVAYDIMCWLTDMLIQYNTSFINELKNNTYRGYHNRMHFIREEPAQGVSNTNVNIIQIERSKIKEAEQWQRRD
ncbi:hypothetical protein FACS1894201_01740 [Bacteroidia bacterium]|nr:hypothetical protein FACS1894201_01740 [Bacteroidia bacterium]